MNVDHGSTRVAFELEQKLNPNENPPIYLDGNEIYLYALENSERYEYTFTRGSLPTPRDAMPRVEHS